MNDIASIAPQTISRSDSRARHLIIDLVLPCILFVSVGMFGWRIRGTRGFGAIPGCIFAGLLFAMAWYMLAREPSEQKTRRYNSGWVVLAATVMIALGGMHGWMQWRSWLIGIFPDKNLFEGLPINPVFGYTWLFICVMPWIGLGGVGIAWTANDVSLTRRAWFLRIVSGCIGGGIAYLAWFLLRPLIIPAYNDWPSLSSMAFTDDAIEDTMTSSIFLGFYVGFIVFEAFRKDWRNVKLALLPGITGGIGWMIIMGSMYGGYAGPNPANWAYWELFAGMPLGLGLGIAYFICNSPRVNHATTTMTTTGTRKLYSRAGQPHSKPEKRNLELILGIYAPILAACINIANSTGEGWEACFTGVRPEFVPSFVIPAILLAATIFVIRLIVLLYRQRPFMPGDGHDNTAEFPVLYWCVLAFQLVCGLVVAVIDACEASFCAGGTTDPLKCLVFPVIHLTLFGVDIVILTAFFLIMSKRTRK